VKAELREYIRQERSEIQKARYKREAKLKVLPIEARKAVLCGQRLKKCVNCEKELSGNRRKYCTRKCQNDFNYRQIRERRSALKLVVTCAAPDCDVSFVQRKSDHIYHHRNCKDRVWHHKQKGIAAQQERDKQLERLIGY
jgi:hypothetical protein